MKIVQDQFVLKAEKLIFSSLETYKVIKWTAFYFTCFLYISFLQTFLCQSVHFAVTLILIV